MTNKITLNLITCRTIQQGVAMETGKTSQKYYDAASIIHMHEDDMKKQESWQIPMSGSPARMVPSW